MTRAASLRPKAGRLPAEVLAPSDSGAFFASRSHPLLFPFVASADRPVESAAHRLGPEEQRASWSARFPYWICISRSAGWVSEAALAHLMLLLVGISRLAAEVVGDLRLNDEPVLAEVFAA